MSEPAETIDPAADRPPTPEEEQAAEAAAEHVDLEQVAQHHREMGELGAQVKGEGDITPPAPCD